MVVRMLVYATGRPEYPYATIWQAMGEHGPVWAIVTHSEAHGTSDKKEETSFCSPLYPGIGWMTGVGHPIPTAFPVGSSLRLPGSDGNYVLRP
jgi:hypothetical protein